MTHIHRTVAEVLATAARSRALKASAHACVIALGISGTAFAQEAADGQPASLMEEVHVTGSRIQVDGMSTPTPVTSLSVNDLHVMAPTTLAAAITQLPQFTNSSVPEGAPSSGWTGASGASILNLRGIGQNRTLVLLDGRRVVASTRKGTLDVNLLPSSLVKNVEVVTGGASAAYGSDAVSGVVNFILDNKFEGIKSDIQGGVTELGDNKNYTVSLAGGVPLGERMHLIGAVDYYSADPIKDATRRDWQQSQGLITLPATRPAGTPARITRSNLRSTQFTEGGLITAVKGTAPDLQWTQFMPGGVAAPFVKGTDFTTSAQVGGDGQDLAWYNYFTPDTSRGSAFAHLTFDLSDRASVFLQGLYGVGDTSYLSPPSGGQFQTWSPTIYWNNAYLPANVAAKMPVNSSFTLGRAGDLDYGASKTIEQQNILKSVTTGVKMDIGDWKLDGYYQYGRTDSNINMNGAIRLDRIYQAIDAVKDPATGNIVCNSTLKNPGNGCQPLNLFGVGSPSQAAIDWITQDISQKQIVEENVVDVAVSGAAFDNWAGPVTMAVGAGWREETFSQHVYPVELHALDMPTLAQAAALGYRGLPPVYAGNPNIFERGPQAAPSGGYKVKEAFTEMQFPLLSEKSFAKSLDLNTAVRLADYEGSGNMWAWKAGIDWSINTDVRFRLTRSRDVRAGTLSERFDTSRGPGNVVDPASGSTVQYAVTVLADGNPNVDPERADTLTFGVVYQPSWLEGFAASIDAFDVKIADAIGQLGAQTIVDQCGQGATQLCGFIQRGADGKIGVIVNTFINTAQARAKGADFEFSYARPVSWFGGDGRIRARLLASYVNELSTQQVGASKVDRAGQTGLTNPQGNAPDWQGTFYLTYERGPISATVQERYINSGTYDATYVQGVDIDDNTVASYATTNLQVSYRGDLTTSGTWETYLNVTNLFDKSPPLVAAFGFTGSTQTNSSLFDIYGRRYNLGVRFNF